MNVVDIFDVCYVVFIYKGYILIIGEIIVVIWDYVLIENGLMFVDIFNFEFYDV